MSLKSISRLFADHPLTRQTPMAAWGRFLQWQIASRLARRPLVRGWIGGAKLLVSSGDAGLTGNLYVGLHEFNEMAFLLHFLRSRDHFYDVGANLGSYSILAGRVVGARTTSFEPVPQTFEKLSANLRLNGLEERSSAEMKAVGSSPGRIRFTSSHDSMNRALRDDEDSDDAIEVEVTTLDASTAHCEPVLMKIDVEGFESEVIKGGSQTFRRDSLKAVIMETNGLGQVFGEESVTILQSMQEFGFQSYAYQGLTRTLCELTEPKEEGNTLFLRDLSFVQERIRAAPLVEVLGRRF